MHSLLEQLHEDHINCARLLDVLNAQWASLASDGDADYRLVLDVLDYIEEYADKIHHAREDAMYNMLKSHYPHKTCYVDALLEEHRVLRQLTLDVQSVVEGALNDVMATRGDVEHALAHYIERQSEHMHREENEIFPQLESILRLRDWQSIRNSLPSESDPLFGERVASRFQSLLERLIR